MVESASAAGSAVNFCVIARPNTVSGHPGLVLCMLAMIPVACVMGSVFLRLGAWPVALSLALHTAALLATFCYVERHAGDFERLSLENDRLIVDTHTPDEDRHVEFNSYWVQIDLEPGSDGHSNRLALRCHGKSIVFGRLLSDSERAELGRELNRRLARLRC